MLIKHIKQSIKNRHSNNGNKNLRNNYRIGVTNQHRNIIANRKFKLEVRDSKKDLLITDDIKDIILDEWIKQGFNKSDISKIGIIKAMQILKQGIKPTITNKKKDFLRHF
jgi:hypothetical protein